MKATNVRFRASTHQLLTSATALLNVSMNSIVNDAVEAYLAQPDVVDALRTGQEMYQATIDRLSGKDPA